MRRRSFHIICSTLLALVLSCTPPNFPVVLRDVNSVLATVDTILSTAEAIWAFVSQKLSPGQREDAKLYALLVGDIKIAARALRRVSDNLANGSSSQEDVDAAYAALKALVKDLQSLLEKYRLTSGEASIDAEFEKLSLNVSKLLGSAGTYRGDVRLHSRRPRLD
jgi:hypothetical protein